MSRAQLIDMAKQDLAHGRAGTQSQADDILRIPAISYTDEDRWQLEMDRIFKRVPLMAATTAELRDAGSYKAMDAAGVQILITRTQSGQVKAFVNMCSHRGAKLMAEGCGHANKFTCPYHAWTFSTEGDLVAIYSNDQFGDLDKSEHGPVLGLI